MEIMEYNNGDNGNSSGQEYCILALVEFFCLLSTWKRLIINSRNIVLIIYFTRPKESLLYCIYSISMLLLVTK